ncbi:MAG TPA: carboxylate--amine ligase, partial [Candidatus Wallbacteria bacterium]|nr:carboxylate--amine ligase [Candidatus Wallbacteria bacterium]
IFTFDGLVDKNGKLVFYTSHTYSDGIMEAVNDDAHVFYYSLRDIPADLEKAGRNTLKAFDVKEKIFHFEFFRRKKDDKIVALEVNMRPPGGLTTDMFNFANDIDIYREWANIVLYNEFKAQYSRKYHCCYIGRKNSKNYAHSHDAIMIEFGDRIAHHEQIFSVFSAALGDYGYLARAESLDQIHEVVNFVHQLK